MWRERFDLHGIKRRFDATWRALVASSRVLKMSMPHLLMWQLCSRARPSIIFDPVLDSHEANGCHIAVGIEAGRVVRGGGGRRGGARRRHGRRAGSSERRKNASQGRRAVMRRPAARELFCEVSVPAVGHVSIFLSTEAARLPSTCRGELVPHRPELRGAWGDVGAARVGRDR